MCVNSFHTFFFLLFTSGEVPDPGNAAPGSALSPQGQSGDKWLYLHHELTSRPNPPGPQLVEPQVCVLLSLSREPSEGSSRNLCSLHDVPVGFQKAEEPCGFFPGPALPFCSCSPCSLVMSSLHFLFSSLSTRSCACFWHRTVKKGQVIDSPCQKVIVRGTAQPLGQLPLQWPVHMACSHLGGSGREQGPK